MPIDPNTFKISFLVADMLSGGWDKVPLPELTSDEIEQLRQQLVQVKNARNATGNLLPDEKVRVNCSVNRGIARLDELERGEGITEQSSIAGHIARASNLDTVPEALSKSMIENMVEAQRELPSIYEDASESPHNPADEGNIIDVARANHLTPVDPVLDLLKQACAILRTRPDVKASSTAPNILQQLPDDVNAPRTAAPPKSITTPKNAPQHSAKPPALTKRLGCSISRSTTWKLLFVIWCL
ncbi:hypothetical protein EG329_009564 [Mollisiaceae sp. DMI_Dod_QoI]|nr:hypothetical protein EG329_009564 [Helotiales sp. DMI_Dod_QoI]